MTIAFTFDHTLGHASGYQVWQVELNQWLWQAWCDGTRTRGTAESAEAARQLAKQEETRLRNDADPPQGDTLPC